jgi:methylenetetrahydrofolate reductase (NADPH)
LGAAALGIHNLLLLTGDDPTAGDQPEAKPVFDLSSQGLIELAATMSTHGLMPSFGGKSRDGVPADMRAIDGPPDFFVGAADMPTAEVSDRWRGGLHAKVAAGARFMQTQVCYDLEVMRRYAELLQAEGVADTVSVLVSNGPLASARSAIWMRENLFGVLIPDAIVDRLAQADDPKAEGIRICQEQIQAMAEIPGISGCHLIAPTNPKSIPETVTGLELGSRRSK